ncbi:hypothetical protein WJX75_002200 [Coccomyxa subellipsoidea]|uniref:Uncharacterized protein n=1 Tax=Coccomyxa subellipsoidea TaxID=248742 RepID=A0ABR2Z301_9CHLO
MLRSDQPSSITHVSSINNLAGFCSCNLASIEAAQLAVEKERHFFNIPSYLQSAIIQLDGVKEYLCRHTDGHRATKIRITSARSRNLAGKLSWPLTGGVCADLKQASRGMCIVLSLPYLFGAPSKELYTENRERVVDARRRDKICSWLKLYIIVSGLLTASTYLALLSPYVDEKLTIARG